MIPYIPTIIKENMYEYLVLLSETVLSAYPILIKKVNASVFAQTGIRMLTYTVLAALAAFVTKSPLSGLSLKELIATGLLNLIHVGSSYTAFEALSAGNAMALFYTYPVWNLIGAAVAFKEEIPLNTIPWMSLALLGAVLLSQPTTQNWSLVGVVSALVAALTETGIYLWFRKEAKGHEEDATPWKGMFNMYGGSLVLWAILLIGGLIVGSGSLGGVPSGSAFQTMFIFNAVVGFLGYALRFFTIPKVSTVAFSVMSFFGVVAAYLLGWLFMGEVPNTIQVIGAAAIIVANTALVRKETA
jgi:drug/metabolite transporter (DMT)-like permease